MGFCGLRLGFLVRSIERLLCVKFALGNLHRACQVGDFFALCNLDEFIPAHVIHVALCGLDLWRCGSECGRRCWRRHRSRRCLRSALRSALPLNDLADSLVCEIHHGGQPVTVFCVPARMMLRIHDATTALRLALALLVLVAYDGLVIHEEHHVSPFLDHGGDIRLRAVLQFHLPSVVASGLIRLFELPHGCVCRYDDIDALVDGRRELVHELAELFPRHTVACAVAR